jgi:hypothetical protein
MIKVEVGGGEEGPPQAEWYIHEKLLLASSGLATGCLAHDTTETTTGTIKMVEADPEAFSVFVNYLYRERLDSAKMDIDQLIAAYLLADYVACPKFADLVFQQIHARTHNESFTCTAHQVDHILSNTLAVQPLRALLLDQVSRGILIEKYDFAANKDDEQLLESHAAELLGGIVQAVKATNVTVAVPMLPLNVQSIYPNVKHYLKHDVVAVEADLIEATTALPASTSGSQFSAAEAEAGRAAIDYVVKQTGATKQKAFNALKASAFRPAQAIRTLKG